MRRVAAVLLTLCCLVSAVGGATAATGGVFQTKEVDADTVVLRAHIQPDGDAVWTIEYRVRLATENATEAFRTLQSDIRTNTSAYTDQFARRMRSTVAVAENATGREMAVENVSVSATIRQLPKSYGVVTYRFVWKGFAATPGQRLLIGDALAGFFLDANSRFIVTWPTGYEIGEVAPDPADRTETSVTWQGPIDFAGDEPSLVLVPASPLPVPTLPLVALLLVLALGFGAGIWWWRRRTSETGAPTSSPVEPTAESGRADAETPEASAGAETGGEPSGPTATEEAAGEPAEELLSPEERVLRLLRERGGRMKQKEVTEELDWSAARTSQVVGDLRDEGDVESFRLGRENVLKLPEDEEE